jgi:hypothetical protein
VIVKLFYFENQKKIIGRKREILALETVALVMWVTLSVTWLWGWLATVAWLILRLTMEETAFGF